MQRYETGRRNHSCRNNDQLLFVPVLVLVQALEIEAREGGDDCETVEECVGGIMGWIGGLVGEKTCVSTEVPCPDIEATALLVEYDASQKVKRNEIEEKT